MPSLFLKTALFCGLISCVSASEVIIRNTLEGLNIALATEAHETYFLEKSYNLQDWEFVGTYEIGTGEEHIEQIIEEDQSNAFYRYDVQETNLESPHDTDGDGLRNEIELRLPGFDPCCEDSNQDSLSDMEEFNQLKALYANSELEGEIKNVFASLVETYGESALPSETTEQTVELENKYSDPFYSPYTDSSYDYFTDIFNNPDYEPLLDPHYDPANDPSINPTANPIDDPRSWGDVIVGYDPYLDRSVEDSLQDPFSFNENGVASWSGDSWSEGYDEPITDLWTGDSWMGGF